MSAAAEEPEEEFDFKHEPATPGKDAVDEALCKMVTDSYQKIMSQPDARITVEWMTGELANGINSAMQAAFASLQMQMMREGLDHKAAEQLARQQILLIAFDLGRRVGSDMEGARQMREMLGDDFGKDFDL